MVSDFSAGSVVLEVFAVAQPERETEECNVVTHGVVTLVITSGEDLSFGVLFSTQSVIFHQYDLL
jgi:hypothetical protein